MFPWRDRMKAWQRKRRNSLRTLGGIHGLRGFPKGLRNPSDAVLLAMSVAGLVASPMASVHATPNEMSRTMELMTNSASLWDRQYMFGDWGGERRRLADKGVTFDLNNIGDFQTDVTGSQTHHATYFGRFRASTDINFNKLANFDGEFFFSGVWQYGQNLSGQYLQVNTLVSSIAGTETYPGSRLL